MAAKYFVFSCIVALFAQNISAQCIGAYNAYDGIAPAYAPAYAPGYACEWGFSPASLAASNGGGLTVSSASPIAPTGIAMTSENAYEGVLAVTGALPFLAAVSLEGVLPTAGSGAVTYSCGNGNVAILNEEIAPGYLGGPLGYNGYGAPGYAGAYGYGYGGCGALY